MVQPVNDTQTYEELREQGAVFKNTDMLIVFFLVQNLLSLIRFHFNRFVMGLSLQSPSTVILEPKKIKSVTVSTFSPSICREVMEPDAMILVF